MTTRIIVTAFLSAGMMAAASGLAITSPADGSPASPGTSLPVTVTPSGSFTQVVLVGEGPIGFSRIVTAPPYQFSLAIPAGTSSGRYSVTALGVTSGGSVSSLPISISVERTDAPVQFDVTPTTITLPVGQRMPLRVVATYNDGAKLDTTRSATTSFSSTSPAVATVDSQGNVSAVGPGSARILVNNSLTIPVVVPATLTLAPQWPVLYASQKMDFDAFSPGMAPVDVRWTINPQLGSISGQGTYTAPRQIAAQLPVMITATSKSDPTKSVTTGIALFPPVSVTIAPTDPAVVILKAGQTFRFAQLVNNALDSGVDWSVSPKTAGSIDAFGLYTAPATISKLQTVTITSTSIADQSKSASVTLTLQP